MRSKSKLEFFRFEGLKKNERTAFEQFYRFCLENEPEGDDYFRFGYEAFGVILYKFCAWMMKDLNKEGIKDIIFFSRDGYIIKKAFELMPGHEEYNCQYAYVSRRSLRVPLLWKYDKPCMEAILPTRYITITDLLCSIGLNSKEYELLVDRHAHKLDDVVKGTSIDKDGNIRNLLMDVWPAVVCNSREEYEAFEGYFKQRINEGKVAVVDIGWRGSMQKFLCQSMATLSKDSLLRGYYLALSSDHIGGIEMRGFYGDTDENSQGTDSLRGYAGLIESLFMHAEGSTKCYRVREDGVVIPELEECEYTNKGELTDAFKCIMKIQEGALSFIRDYIKWEKCFLNGFDYRMTFHNMNRFSQFPRLSDVRLFSELEFYNNGTTSRLVNTRALWRYFVCVGELKKDLYHSRWRIGFMKHLCKAPLPYSTIMRVVMKLTK